MKRLIITFFYFLLCTYIFAQEFTGKIEDAGNYYRLTFTANSHNVSDFTPPSLKDFEVLSGPNTSTFSSYQVINGKTSHTQTTSYVYILSAKKAGKHTIGSATIRVKGKRLQSNPITFSAHAGSNSQNSNNGTSQNNVSSQNTLQKAGTRISNKDVFIDVTPSRTKIKEQEAVLLTYKVHTKLNVGLSQTQLTNQPDFKGMISQEIALPDNQIQTVLEHRNGVTYRTGTILQYVIFPQKSGKLVIPSLSFDLTILQQREPMSLADAFFNGGGNIGVQIKRKVPTLTLDVESLPEPKPKHYSGAVGAFTIEGHLLNKEIKTNDIMTYRLEVSGLGNLKLITPPEMVLPRDFETYDVKTTENIEITPQGFKGKVIYDYVFVPQNIGQFEIPSLSFTYYDPSNNTYKTLHTQAQTIDVKKGKNSSSDINKQLSQLQSDIRTIHTSKEITEIKPFTTWGTLQYFALQALLLVMFIGFIVYEKIILQKSRHSSSQRLSKIQKEVLKQLATIEKGNESMKDSDYYAALNQCLMNFISNASKINRADLNTDSIKKYLSEQHMPEDQILSITKLIETLQCAQYAPIQMDKRNELHQEVIDAIQAITSIK